MKDSLTSQLLLEIQQMPISMRDRHRAALHVIDWIACACLGKRVPAPHIVNNHHDAFNEQYSSYLLGGAGNWASVIAHNISLCHVVELDDIHCGSGLKLGAMIIPASLALAEHVDCSGETFLDGIIKGYEMAIRVANAYEQAVGESSRHISSCKLFATTLACATILAGDQLQILSSLSLASQYIDELRQINRTEYETNAYYRSIAIKGATSAMQACQGEVEYAANVLDMDLKNSGNGSKHNFISVDKNDWQIYRINFKPWPACAHAHPAMDTLLSAIKRGLIRQDVCSIKVFTYKEALSECDIVNPQTERDARYSIQQALASILLWGEPDLSHYQKPAMNHPDIVALRSKISIFISDEFTQAYPQQEGARSIFILKDGSEVTHEVNDKLGAPMRPMKESHIKTKVETLMSKAGMSSNSIREISNLGWEKGSSMRQFGNLLKD